AFDNGSIGRRNRLSRPLRVALDPVNDKMGIVNLRVTPDSPQSMTSSGAIGLPIPFIVHASEPFTTLAPAATIARVVASVSSDASAFLTVVAPFVSNPANSAR